MAQKAQVPTRRPAVRRNRLLESLENRQLMAGFSANFNFQPASSSIPSGYVADSGKSYRSQGAYTYGWNADNTSNVVDRYTSADARYDTFAYVGRSASTWEVAVPNGQYRVNVTAGDPSSTSARYGLKVENSTLIEETPHAGNRWSEGSGTVNVTDGKLTLAGTTGAWNNKVTSIQITQVSGTDTSTGGAAVRTPLSPSWAGAWGVTQNSLNLGWGDRSNNESGFIIQQSTNNSSFNEIGRVGANTTSFQVNSLSAGTNYYYRVLSYNTAGSASSNVVSVRTVAGASPAPVAQAPTAPIWTYAGANANGSITVSWGDGSWNESGFIIQRSTDNRSFAEVARVGAGTTSFINTGLAAGTTYYYKVLSYNSAGSTAGSVTSAKTVGGTATVTKPATPGWLASWTSGPSSIALNWADSSNNETGFIIERSTNGSSYSEVARVGANTTTYTAGSLSASTKYYFRVMAYNSAGNSAASQATNATTAASTTGGNTGGNNTGGNNTGGNNTGTITNKYALSGISANTNGDAPSKYAAVLNDVGIKNVRIWYSFTNWNAQPDAWYINRAIAYKNAGYTVMLAVLNPNPASSEAQAKSFFQRLSAYPGLTGAVDYWQINNEPNMGEFWHGSLQQYVQTNLKPAYEVLKAKGETVVGAGPTWDVNVARQLTSLGYLNYCDYAAFHPYGESADLVIQRAREARAAFNNKPMMVTEWNIQGISDQNRWVAELNKAAVGLSNIAYMNYYFALKQSATHVGVGGLLKYDNSKNTLFYNAVKGWLD